jgi:GPH family glycoside/pentoside/hexuronide:cation symporter
LSDASSTSAPSQGRLAHEPVSVREKIGYGLGDTASNLYWKLFEFFQLIFYTDVFGISAASAATMFFVTKLWDAINDPIVGFLADRTRTAWGRFRPWLLWSAVPFAITGILTFYTPDLSPRGKLIYAYVTYILVFMAYTAINIPYGALMGVISANSLERTSVSTYRFVLAFGGGLVVQKFTEPLVDFFGRRFGESKMALVNGVQTVIVDRQTGFFWTVVCYSVVAVMLFLITFWTTKERVQPAQGKNNRFSSDISDLLKNRPWLVLLAVGLFQIFSDWTRGSAIAYYFTYYVGSEFGNFLVTGTVAGIVGMLMTKRLTAIFGKKILLIAMNVGKAILIACFYFLGNDQVELMYILNTTAMFISGPVPVLLWAMYADVADYSEWKNGRRATGLVFSAATFAQKLGGALGAAVPGWALAAYEFRPPVAGVRQAQSAETIQGMILMMSLIPALFLLGAIVAMCFYGINQSVLRRIEADLAARKSLEHANMHLAS